MGVMTAPDFWSGQDRVLTVEDMENMPDDEFRYELDDGVLIVSPAPSTLHQLAVTRLAVISPVERTPAADRSVVQARTRRAVLHPELEPAAVIEYLYSKIVSGKLNHAVACRDEQGFAELDDLPHRVLADLWLSEQRAGPLDRID